MGNAIMERFGIPEGVQVGAYMARLHKAVEEGKLEPCRDFEYYLKLLAEEPKEDN
jgi:hypothetical protein